MQWNSVPEIISTFVLFVIFINSRVTHTMPSSRERLFRFILIYSISSFILNIISVWTITSYQEANRLFSLIVNSATSSFTPLYPFVYHLHPLYIYEHIPRNTTADKSNFFALSYQLPILFLLVSLCYITYFLPR